VRWGALVAGPHELVVGGGHLGTQPARGEEQVSVGGDEAVGVRGRALAGVGVDPLLVAPDEGSALVLDLSDAGSVGHRERLGLDRAARGADEAVGEGLTHAVDRVVEHVVRAWQPRRDLPVAADGPQLHGVAFPPDPPGGPQGCGEGDGILGAFVELEGGQVQPSRRARSAVAEHHPVVVEKQVGGLDGERHGDDGASARGELAEGEGGGGRRLAEVVQEVAGRHQGGLGLLVLVVEQQAAPEGELRLGVLLPRTQRLRLGLVPGDADLHHVQGGGDDQRREPGGPRQGGAGEQGPVTARPLGDATRQAVRERLQLPVLLEGADLVPE
jgi:hypothetical protein